MALDFSTTPGLPLGLSNNNPGNLRSTFGIPWMGQNGSVNDFCTFTDCSYGLRAMAVDLSNKISSDGLNTITEIITKYAPPSENDTQAYIDNVSTYTGWGADDPIDLTTANLANLMRAQINVEQGTGFSAMISDADIQQGISMIPQSIIDKFTNFFVNNPVLATASALGGVAVIAALIFIAIGKTPKFLNKIL